MNEQNEWRDLYEHGLADRNALLERVAKLEKALRKIAASHGASDHACFRRDLADQALTPLETEVRHEIGGAGSPCPCKGHPFNCVNHPHDCGCQAKIKGNEP